VPEILDLETFRSTLVRRLPAPLLVLRLAELERIAWREGRAAARALERKSSRAFLAAALQTLRRSDVLAHDAGREDFLVGLLAKTRLTGEAALPVDARATLSRLASEVQNATGLRVETGWTVITEADRGRSTLELIAAALERGARERERFAFFSTIGHELRTPLTSIRGYLETLIDDEYEAPVRRKFLETAQAEALRMQRMLDGMFEISLLDLRTGAQNTEAAQLETAVRTAADAVAAIASRRGTTISVEPGPPRSVALGRDRLTQILINLLENSIKHGREGGKIALRWLCRDERFAELLIDDDGPGIQPAEREHVFSLAQRGSSGGPGSGIGLAVVRLFLERAGGEVAAETSPLGGARFVVRLPLATELRQRLPSVS
jgi:signal transduction histidine kinase